MPQKSKGFEKIRNKSLIFYQSGQSSEEYISSLVPPSLPSPQPRRKEEREVGKKEVYLDFMMDNAHDPLQR